MYPKYPFPAVSCSFYGIAFTFNFDKKSFRYPREGFVAVREACPLSYPIIAAAEAQHTRVVKVLLPRTLGRKRKWDFFRVACRLGKDNAIALLADLPEARDAISAADEVDQG